MKTNLFDFTLPESAIATHPAEPRDHSRLLHVNGAKITDAHFYDLPHLLEAGDMLVFNDSKVIPARLFAKKNDAVIELLLHKATPNEAGENEWLAFAKPGKKCKIEDTLTIEGSELTATVLHKQEDGQILFRFNLSGAAFWVALEACGHMPLPPYIKREDTADDKDRYQTVYAKEEGSVAAPTAGLHFMERTFDAFKARGIGTAYVTLHVGAGTFQPVKVEDTDEHIMHSEYAVLDAETAQRINETKARGGKIIAVGTTAMRTLESATDEANVTHPFSQETDIFITPGYRFRCVDQLLTNFHLPKSTLFMLISAFSGLENMQAAYAHAIKNDYRFYSYGDACLLDLTK
jgi:S-adenosylmethionine:tRNA ribosyltransferase-isomerase